MTLNYSVVVVSTDHEWNIIRTDVYGPFSHEEAETFADTVSKYLPNMNQYSINIQFMATEYHSPDDKDWWREAWETEKKLSKASE